MEQSNSAVDHPTWLSVLIPVAIAAVVTTIIYPDTSDKIREYWENQFEDANEGPLIVNDDESIDLVPKYGITPVTNATKRALRVALGEEEINTDKKLDIVEPADKVQPGTIPSIPKKPSAEELTTLVGSVAAAVKNDGKDFDALLAERKQRAAEQSDVPKSSQPRTKKRDLVRKATKKLIMPWKKWESL